jgi:nickel/cobalt transporter (NicO) family protein
MAAEREAAPFEGRLRRFQSVVGEAALELHKIGRAPPRFRLRFARRGLAAALAGIAIETIRSSGERQLFHMRSLGNYQESVEEIPEPHDFKVIIRISRAGSSYEHEIEYIEPDHWRRSTSGWS